MFIYSSIIPNIVAITKNTQSNCCLTVGAKVSILSILYICKKPYITKLGLNLVIDLFDLYFTLNTHFQLISFWLGGNIV